MEKTEQLRKVDKLAVSMTEAAALLDISRPTLYQLSHSEGFPCFCIGTRRLVSVDGLREWIKKQTEASA